MIWITPLEVCRLHYEHIVKAANVTNNGVVLHAFSVLKCLQTSPHNLYLQDQGHHKDVAHNSIGPL